MSYGNSNGTHQPVHRILISTFAFRYLDILINLFNQIMKYLYATGLVAIAKSDFWRRDSYDYHALFFRMHLRDELCHLLEIWVHKRANWQDYGAKKDTMGLEKSMNWANLTKSLLEVNGTNPVFYLCF